MMAIVLFLLLCIGFYFLYVYFRKYEEMNEHYRELSRFVDYKELHPEYVRVRIENILPGYTGTRYEEISAKQIRKFFKNHPEKLAEAEIRFNEWKRNERLYEEGKKRELIKKRVFAYDYEDLLYELYAPLAEKDFRGQWHTYYNGYKADELIMRISEIRNIPTDKAVEIFKILVEHELVHQWDSIYTINHILEESSDPKYKTWDIVSDTDMNLGKWMNEHGYKSKTEIKRNKLCQQT